MMVDDQEWLGDDAEAGPTVRAGLGILMATGDWTWWRHPSAVTAIMLDAVHSSGIVEWGGNPAVILAHEWLDINTALEVANAFKILVARREGDLRIKIQRSVYSWNEIAPVNTIRNDLGMAFSQQRIFIEWPLDRRPRSKVISREKENDLVIASAENLIDIVNSLVNSFQDSHLVTAQKPADIAVGTLEDFLSLKYSAELVVILDVDRDKAFFHLDTIRISTGAQCAIFLLKNQENINVWFEIFGGELNKSNSIDAALAIANKNVIFGAVFLASTQKFIIQSSQYFPRGSFGKEKSPKSDVGEIIGENSVKYKKEIKHRRPAVPNFEIEEMRMQARPPSIRVLNSMVKKGSVIINKFPPSGFVDISINIIPITPLHGMVDVFPDGNIEWNGNEKNLEVYMFEVGAAPVSVPFRVPRLGKSDFVEFKYFVRHDIDIDLRFVVSEGARILQTGRMQGKPDCDIYFFVESLNTPIEQDKKQFDIALLVNDSLGKKASATVLTGERVNLTVLDGTDLDAARIKLRSILESCVNFVDVSLPESLFDLANHGKMLFDGLKHQTEGWPEKINRIQLTTPSDVYFPLEYLYDGDIPESIIGGLCVERSNCLNAGLAKEGCAIRSAGEQLCPMGFLGITAVIERQTWDRAMDKTVWLSQSKDLENRHRISDLGRAVFAASDKADEFADGELSSFFEPVRIKDIEKQLGSRKLNWADWRQTIAEKQPKLLVLIPHIENSNLHIGTNQKLAFGAIQRRHLGNSEPVVIAIGCNSAIGIAATMGLPSVLIRQGARVVVAALTGVLGRYANIATRDLAVKLVAASSGETPVSIGSLLTQLRRQFLAKDNPLGLVLIAFGDADYTLGGKL